MARPEELRVRLGEWDVHSDTETFTNVEMDIQSIHHHPEFHAGLSGCCPDHQVM